MIQNQVGGGSGIEYTVKTFRFTGPEDIHVPADAKNYIVANDSKEGNVGNGFTGIEVSIPDEGIAYRAMRMTSSSMYVYKNTYCTLKDGVFNPVGLERYAYYKLIVW